jgi:hypothetical protein
MAREKPPIGLMKHDELIFCESYLAHGDKVQAVRDAGMYIGLEDTEESKGDDMLAKPAVRDYLLVMRTGEADKLENTIERLEAIRRESWRQGDYKQTAAVEMQIADLKGWKIERQAIMTTNVGAGDFKSMGTDALVDILRVAQESGALAKHGVDIGTDGSLVRLPVKGEVSDAQFEEIHGDERL